MIVGRVVNTVVSSRKYDSLQGLKLLVIEPYYGDDKTCFVAADIIGAGTGELVLITTGDTTKYALEKDAPIDALVVGILDREPSI
ncbi:ethanolamine utilization protein EutN [Clostridium homopropionicum DSM 5847]|uniref:Ethanolamine utilization protein EutN n=1 Tax=Clostridium homopropionicum DSM 5847 TaxID=1121318 RepID=A0A0L6Z6X3_9CLOT|nr:EutN/CcmL family microcompartment protein [Clostridium homopropionicum]KOA18588.1 ethanolamine utilization protein EutN [Clostridium homopropionicum DSM 5847]SFG49139.1 ethanolamine utilization protein EutN [Clostridium homopropionicum]